MPDSNKFPVQIHGLAEQRRREATLADLTCDSDGKLEKLVDVETGKAKKALAYS